MSGFVCSYAVQVFTPRMAAEPAPTNIEYIDNGQTVSFEQESAGKVLRVLGVVASIFIPVAAPAIWGAVTASGAIAAGLGAAMTSTFGASLTSVLGSAMVGGLMNAGIAAASGASGAAIWRAAGIGALGGGIGGWARAGNLAGLANASTPAGGAATSGAPLSAGLPGAVPAAGPTPLTPGLELTPAMDAGIGAGAVVSASGGMLGTIQRVFPNATGADVQRIGAAIINAAVNNQDMGQLNALVAQQKAELDALASSNKAIYDQKIAQAQKIIQDADRMDPEWWARVRMADVAGMEANEFKQGMRNIAVKQGGAFDAGQQKAYERGAKLHTARSKALAWGQGYKDAFLAQNQLRGTAAGLLGPDEMGFRIMQQGQEIDAAARRARQEANYSTWGGVLNAFTGGDFAQATRPDPSADDEDNDQQGAFWQGLRWPSTFGGGNG